MTPPALSDTLTMPRFLCDEMLAGLGRWLRAAGYDTATARPGSADRELLAQAMREDRLFLTRDRQVPGMRGAQDRVILLSGNELEDNALELREQLGLDWERCPFTRCLVCNTAVEARPPQPEDPLPRDVVESSDPVSECPGCGRLYWEGGHVQDMRLRLRRWSRGRRHLRS